MEKIDPLYKKKKKKRIFRPKTDPFFSKSRKYGLHKNRPFLSGIQNDDAYLLYVGVAGPGPKSLSP